ncbi:FBD-associated F-box protein At1g66310 [Medicago truncatula]|nr:FBD-associated F-box protein At1g66310 [Medicago truncatula]
MKKRRKNNHNHTENKDRISDLPDCILFHILSSLETKHAVQTTILSTRWNNLWKRLPTLRLNSSHFKTLKSFTKFVSRVLSLRDDSTALHTLYFQRKGCVEPPILSKLVEYAASHNVQRLDIFVRCDGVYFPPYFFKCNTLTSLNLSSSPIPNTAKKPFPSLMTLPALTSLSLQWFAFHGNNSGRVEPFSRFKRLNTLILENCQIVGVPNLCISSTTLANLTIQSNDGLSDFCGIELSAPSLCTFSFTGNPLEIRYGSRLSSIEHVSIDVNVAWISEKFPSVLLSWLIEFSSIKSLAVSSTTLQVLSVVPDLLKVEFSSLCNLKSLKVKMRQFTDGLSRTLIEANISQLLSRLEEAFKERSKTHSSIPDGIVDFLLQNSPSAKVDVIT